MGKKTLQEQLDSCKEALGAYKEKLRVSEEEKLAIKSSAGPHKLAIWEGVGLFLGVGVALISQAYSTFSTQILTLLFISSGLTYVAAKFGEGYSKRERGLTLFGLWVASTCVGGYDYKVARDKATPKLFISQELTWMPQGRGTETVYVIDVEQSNSTEQGKDAYMCQIRELTDAGSMEDVRQSFSGKELLEGHVLPVMIDKPIDANKQTRFERALRIEVRNIGERPITGLDIKGSVTLMHEGRLDALTIPVEFKKSDVYLPAAGFGSFAVFLRNLTWAAPQGVLPDKRQIELRWRSEATANCDGDSRATECTLTSARAAPTLWGESPRVADK